MGFLARFAATCLDLLYDNRISSKFLGNEAFGLRPQRNA
jgi:hypothetical protein